jgi:hypothetical protein
MNPNRINKCFIFTAFLIGLQINAVAAERVEDKKEWTEKFDLSTDEPTLEIHNIWGDVRVLPGPEGEITLSIREHRSAPTEELFQRSRKVYGLEIEADKAGVMVHVGEHRQSWRGSNPCRRCRAEYQFEARVPPNTRLYVSTVNDGRVEVSDIEGQINADNVNGPVSIYNASACESVESINGEVSLSFATAPGTDCHIETINGDISIRVPGDTGLDVAVDLNNGRMTSELPLDPLAIPARVEHRESGGSHKYTIEQSAGVRLAGGGPVFSVTSMNGDLRIQKTK